MAYSPPSSVSGRLSAGKSAKPLSAPSASGRLSKEPEESPNRSWRWEFLRRLWWWTMLAFILACAAKGSGAFIYQQF